MPRPRHAQGRPGTPVIPTDWEATHRPVADKTRTATVSMRHPGTTQAWSETDEQMVEAPLAPYAVDTSARVQALATQAREVDAAASDTETVASYLVTVTAGLTPLEGDLVTVTASDDPALTGRTLRVLQVIRGTERFERDLFCTLTD